MVDHDFFQKYAVQLDHERFLQAVQQLKKLIESKACEEEIQRHITQYPYILSQQFAHCHHVFPKVRLGGKYEADYFCLDIPSPGKEWIGIEIENPTLQIITRAGRKSAKLEHALQQVRDWRSWIKENLSTARSTPDRGGVGLEDIDPQFWGWIIVGRRSNFTPQFNELRKQVERDERIIIRSWDGIVEWAESRAEHWYRHSQSLRILMNGR